MEKLVLQMGISLDGVLPVPASAVEAMGATSPEDSALKVRKLDLRPTRT
jgi:hypothetical protein